MEKYEKIVTVCPYCGSGCKIEFTVDKDNNRIVSAKGAAGHINEGHLCLKGLYGWDYLNDPHLLTGRLRHPLIRKNGRSSPLEEVSWDEAIAFTAERLKAIIKEYGPDSIMGAGSARGPGNEAGYITQKFMRAAIGTNNVDHCARLCHAASVSGLHSAIGEGAMSMSVAEIEAAEVIFNIGYNAPAAHPLVARRIVKAKQRGAKLICADPRLTETARIADIFLQQKGGRNLALLNAMAYTILEEDLVDHAFVTAHVHGYAEYKEQVLSAEYAPERQAEEIGVPATAIRQAARLYAASHHSIILWGMGITQFTQGVENVAACANLALLTGNFGRPATGVGPVRGQNNVQGACDMGILPDIYPGYQNVEDAAVRTKFEKAWGVKLSPHKGLPLTLLPERVLREKNPRKQIHAYYIVGEDPAQSDPNLAELRAAFAKIDFIVLQDIFLNRTSEYADVILPATSWGEHEALYTNCDRSIQIARKLLEPTAGLKTDWEIQCAVATAMGYPMHYDNVQEIWAEVRSLAPIFAGATYEKIEQRGYVQWPCYDIAPTDVGTEYLHADGHFDTIDGKGTLIFSPSKPVAEEVDAEYPLVFCTVREVGHYSARTMTGNCRMLQTLEDEPGTVVVNPADCQTLGIRAEELVRVSSRRGSLVTRCRPSERVKKGAVYMTYHWWLGPCNELTSSALDPQSHTPEFKYCACRIEKIIDQQAAENQLKVEYAAIRQKTGLEKTGE